jgi:Mn2+/Fe2+ NRAMP family transporter
MGEQDPQNINFIQENLVLIGVVVLGIFVYLVMLIRKRWKQNFLHSSTEKEQPK